MEVFELSFWSKDDDSVLINCSNVICVMWASLCLGLFMIGVVQPASAALIDANRLSTSGYLRTYASMNMEDALSSSYDAKNEFSMVRSQMKLESDLTMDWARFKLMVRGNREYETDYLKQLEGQGGDITEFYDDEQVRELYVDLPVTDNIQLRLGKQMVSWGETDFFQAMDVIHAFDNSWRIVLAPNDERRIPMTMANMQIDLPQYGGSLQLLYRPGGINDGKDIATNQPATSGRWAAWPMRAGRFTGDPRNDHNFDHPAGDPDDPDYGIRWSSNAQLFGTRVDYTLSYLRTHKSGGVTNCNPASVAAVPDCDNAYKVAPAGPIETIHPELDLFGITGNTYVPSIDSVLRTEIAYIPNNPLQAWGRLFNPAVGGLVSFPGAGGIKEKQTFRMMLGLDTQWDYMYQELGADGPLSISFQVFDTYLPDYNKSKEQLVETAGVRSDHSAIGTVVLRANYFNARVNPFFAYLHDLSYGGGLILPRISFTYGTNWRAMLEYQAWLQDAEVPSNAGQFKSNDVHLFDTQANNDQLLFRLTYQF